MAELETQVDRLLALTADTEPDREAFAACIQKLGEAVGDATPEERDAALSRMAVALNHPNPQIAGYVAITGGAFVEYGSSPQVWFSAMLPLLSDTLQAAVQFTEACEAALPPEDEEADLEAEEAEGFEEEEYDEDEDEYEEEYDEEEDEDDNGLWLGDRLVHGEIVEQIVSQNAKGYHAYEALEIWCLPAIACLSYSPELRTQAKQNPELLDVASRLARFNGQAEFLRKMLLVLDDEPLLVIHPESKKGFRCRIGGLGDNFQLHTLMADALLSAPRAGMLGRLFGKKEEGIEDGLSGTRPHPVAIAVAKGEASQSASLNTVGVWNVYQWTAWGRDGKLADGFESSEYWVWNEGVPADIAPFEGLRVVLLGTPSYQREWSTARLFNRMKAYVRVEERLSPQDVETWLQRFASAPRP